MKLSKNNIIFLGLLIIMLSSCHDNSTAITSFKNALVIDITAESRKSIDELDRKIERLLIEENNNDCIPT